MPRRFFPAPPSKQEGSENKKFSLAMLFDTFYEFFFNSTLLKFCRNSFGLPENFTVVRVRLEFSQRLPALGNSSFAIKLRDWLTREFGLDNVKQNFKIPTLGCLSTGPVQADENLLARDFVR